MHHVPPCITHTGWPGPFSDDQPVKGIRNNTTYVTLIQSKLGLSEQCKVGTTFRYTLDTITVKSAPPESAGQTVAHSFSQ